MRPNFGLVTPPVIYDYVVFLSQVSVRELRPSHSYTFDYVQIGPLEDESLSLDGKRSTAVKCETSRLSSIHFTSKL